MRPLSPVILSVFRIQTISAEGLEFIKKWESLKLVAYLCPAQKWTVGFGHTGKDVYSGLVITKDQAEKLFRKDVSIAEAVVRKLIFVKLTQKKFDAVCSLTYNIGGKNLETSTLLKKINNQEWLEASKEFKEWHFSKGKSLPGLVKRREEESVMFLED